MFLNIEKYIDTKMVRQIKTLQYILQSVLIHCYIKLVMTINSLKCLLAVDFNSFDKTV